jgi:ABC-type transport system involved in multi-copper enzyme maturation permease subunit
MDPPEAVGAARRRSTTPTLWRRILGISRAEGKRLTRRTFAGFGLGVIALFTLMATLVTFLAGDMRPDLGPMGGAVTDLTSSDGLIAGLSAAADMIGIVVLALWAAAVSADYSTGWIRVMVQAEPRRWRLIAGKLLTLVGLTLVATMLATGVSVTFAPLMAAASDISTAAWFDDAVATVLRAWFDLTVVVLVWGALGFAVATLTRSAIVAIAGGIGYLMVFEGLLSRVAEDLTPYLPGSVLDAVAAGGNAVLGYGPALALATLFAVIAIAISTAVFSQRDVTS